MRVTINIVNDNKMKELELTDNATPFDVLNLLEIAPDTVIITRANRPIPLDTKLKPEDQIVLIRVVSGG